MSAFRVSPHHPAHAELARIMTLQLERAELLLKDWARDPETAFHEARRRFKKVRAAARLARAVDKDLARAINDACRAAGRALGAGRDADVLIEAARDLAELAEDADARAALLAFAEARPAEAQTDAERADAVEEALKGVEAAAAPIRALAAADSEPKHLRKALKRILRRADAAFADAHRPGASDEARHAWRKRVKDVGYAARLLRDAWPLDGAPPVRLARDLGQVLGEERDLMLLAAALADDPDASAAARLAVQERSARLRRHAERLGRALHSVA